MPADMIARAKAIKAISDISELQNTGVDTTARASAAKAISAINSILGKNRFNPSTFLLYKNPDASGNIVDANTEGNLFDCSDYVPFFNGETIYFSNNGSPITVLFATYTATKTFINRITASSYTASQDGFLVFRTTHGYDPSKIQVEAGSAVTAWVAFNGYSFYKDLKSTNTALTALTQTVSNQNTLNENYKYIFDKGICVGDSLTEGYASATRLLIDQTYPYFLAKLMGNIPITNAGHSGLTTSQWWTNKFELYDFSDKDFCILYLGTNGGLTDTLTSDTTISGGQTYLDYANTNTGNYCKIIEGAKSQNPNIRIFLVKCRQDSISTLTTTNSVISQIGTKYSLPVLDITQTSFIDLSTAAYHVDGETVHYGSIGNLALTRLLIRLMTDAIASSPSSYETATL